MKRVVIEVRRGKARIVSQQGKVEVVIRHHKPDRSVSKLYRTCVYHMKRVARHVGRMLRIAYPHR